MTPQAVRDVKFRSTPGRGYSPVDVDSLLSRVAIQLEAGQSPATTIEHTQIRKTYDGYEPAEVDRLLDDLRGLTQNDWNTAQPRDYRRGRSTPLLKVALFLAFVAAIGGGIGEAATRGPVHASLLVVAEVGAGVTFAWTTFTKLSSDTAVDESFQARFFILGTVALIGGIAYAVKGHHGGFTITTMFAGLGIATMGGLVVAAEVRDAWHRYHDPSKARLTPSEAIRAAHTTILLVTALLAAVVVIVLVAALIG